VSLVSVSSGLELDERSEAVVRGWTLEPLFPTKPTSPYPKACRVPRCRILKSLVHVPRLPCRRQQPIAILRQQQPLGDETIRCRSQSRSPDIARCVARFDRWPWIACALPFGLGCSERDHRTLNGKQITFAVAGRAQRPAVCVARGASTIGWRMPPSAFPSASVACTNTE